MAIFKRLSREQILKDYTHYGLMYGIVPVYIGDPNGESRICVRNWWPELLFDVVDFSYWLLGAIIQQFYSDYEQVFFYKLTAEIKDKENLNAK